MDPDVTLAEMRKRVERANQLIDAGAFGENQGEWNEITLELVEYVAALDRWVSLGGHLPEPWRRFR